MVLGRIKLKDLVCHIIDTKRAKNPVLCARLCLRVVYTLLQLFSSGHITHVIA